jgi:hypothetical protein
MMGRKCGNRKALSIIKVDLTLAFRLFIFNS